MHVVITGPTGLIGRRLVAELEGNDTTVLSRDVGAAERSIDARRFIAWDGTSTLDPEISERADVVYHLAGGRWSADRKRRIWRAASAERAPSSKRSHALAGLSLRSERHPSRLIGEA